MAIKVQGSTIIDDSRVLINTGNVGVGTTNPNSVVSVSNTSIVHAGIVTARLLYGDGSNLTNLPPTPDTDWIRTSVGIHTVASKVGIGTTNPTENLEVLGNIRINQGDLLVGAGRTFVVSTSTATTSYISARSGILSTTEQFLVFPPVDNQNNFDNNQLLGNDLDFTGSVSIGQTVFTILGGDQGSLNNIFNVGGFSPSLDSGRYFLVPSGDEAISLFGGRSNRVIAYNFGTGQITVESPAQINDGNTTAEFFLVFADVSDIPNGEFNFVGIGTDKPEYPLHVAPPQVIKDSVFPALYVDGSAYFRGKSLKIGEASITLDASVSGAEKLQFSRGNNIGIHSESSNSIAVSGSLAADSVIETVGIRTDNIVSLNVTVGVKTTGDVYLGVGSTEKFLIEGNKTPHLHLTSGRTYRFNQDDPSNVNHTLKFYTDLAQTTEVSGVTTVGTAGSEGAYTQLSVHSINTPSRIFYGSISTSHVGNMTMVEATSNNTNSGTVNFDKVGIGTTNAQNYRLRIIGDSIITGTETVQNLNVSGIGTITSPSETNAHSRWKVVNSGSSAYRFTGPGQDGSENNPNIYLVRGQRYIFDVNASGHPFQLRIASGGAAYSDGVTNNGAQSGQVIINVQHDAPPQLYYQCTVHGGMVGNIYIIGGPQVISGIVTATSFSGSGASLTDLNASNLGSGTVPDARFPATLPAISGANLTALNASELGSGTVPDARFPATLPAISGANLTSLTGASAATYGNSTNVAQVTVDANGRITGITNVAISGAGGGGSGGGSGTFDTGITTSIYASVTGGIGTAQAGLSTTAANNDIFIGPGIAYSFPSTAGKSYVIESIHITNIYNTNLFVSARQDFNGGQNVPTAQRVVVPYQGSLELLEEPIIAKPSDVLSFQALAGVGTAATGVNNGLDSFIIYSEKTDTDYIGTGVTVSTPAGTEMFTSNTNPSVIQSLRLCNYDLNIDVDASVSIYRGGSVGGILTTGVRQGYLVYNMTIPKNSVIEVLERPKYLAANDTIVVGIAGTTLTNSLSATLSGKYIT